MPYSFTLKTSAWDRQPPACGREKEQPLGLMPQVDMNISTGMDEAPTCSFVWDGFMEKAWVHVIKDSCYPRLLHGEGGSNVLPRDNARKEAALPREVLRSRRCDFGRVRGGAM